MNALTNFVSIFAEANDIANFVSILLTQLAVAVNYKRSLRFGRDDKTVLRHRGSFDFAQDDKVYTAVLRLGGFLHSATLQTS